MRAPSMPSRKDYSEKLLDPRWQRLRLKRLEKSEWRCDLCCEDDRTLHVHHKAYFKGREPWEYDESQLSVLCERCHKFLHDERPDILDEVVSRLALDGPDGRRDIGIVLASLLFPNITTSDDFSSRAVKELIESGLSADLRAVWDHIWFTVINNLAEKKNG